MEIRGTGSYLPGKIITNDDLSEVVDTNDEWISSRTGICQRHISEGETTSEMAARAAVVALEDAEVSPEEVELIIVATMTGDGAMPGTACKVQKEIGAVHAACFDLSAACTGFVFALNTANAYLACTGMHLSLEQIWYPKSLTGRIVLPAFYLETEPVRFLSGQIIQNDMWRLPDQTARKAMSCRQAGYRLRIFW